MTAMILPLPRARFTMNTIPNTAGSISHRPAPPLVLIANSDTTARTWIEATVSSAGLHALGFESASALLAQIPTNGAACAILDVHLSDANGLELQDKLAQMGTTVMFLTRERCVTSTVRAIKAGAVDFLMLPCNEADLVHALGQTVRKALSSWMERERLIELRSRYDGLTPRECEVFALVATGMRNKQVAYQLGITDLTVQIHRGQVMRKMQARSLATLVRMADALHLSDAQIGVDRRHQAADHADSPFELLAETRIAS